MATSGTVATTTVNIAQLAESAHRRCGIMPAMITAEMMGAFIRNLFVKTSAWANRGVLLWTLDRVILGIYKQQVQYALPAGTVDILDANYRTQHTISGGATASSAGGTAANAFNLDTTLSAVCLQTSANGNISYNIGQATLVNTIGFLGGPGVTATHLVYEYSADNVTWTTALDPGVVTQADNVWVWYDLPLAAFTKQYWRVRETGGGIISTRQICLQNTPQEMPMSAFNIDDYDALPNKFFQSTRSLQFYKERLINNPTMNIWPISTGVFDQLVVRRHRQMMDPGVMINQMEVPQRWLDALQTGAAAWTADELFGNPAAPAVTGQLVAYLDQKYQRSLGEAENEESDGAPIYFAPSIGVYTR